MPAEGAQRIDGVRATDDVPPQMSRGRRRTFIGLSIVLGFVVAFASVEVVLRVLRLRPEPRRLDIRVEPGGKFQAPDPELGFHPLAGRYEVLLDGRHRWRLTNLSDTTRITKPVERYAGDASKPGIWVFGCSFVQGWGLDDEETLPWKLQERVPDHDVVNFGVGGYGTVQSLLQFRRALRERPKPAVAILGYGAFHDDRNVRTGAWRDANFSFERFGTTAQPYARFDSSDGLRFEWGSGDVPLMWLRARSAAVDVAVVGYDRLRDGSLRAHDVSERLIEQFVETSRGEGVRFVLAGVWPTPRTRATLRRFAERGVHTVDVAFDPKDPRSVIPYDLHPSGFTNEQAADALAGMLRESLP